MPVQVVRSFVDRTVVSELLSSGLKKAFLQGLDRYGSGMRGRGILEIRL